MFRLNPLIAALGFSALAGCGSVPSSPATMPVAAAPVAGNPLVGACVRDNTVDFVSARGDYYHVTVTGQHTAEIEAKLFDQRLLIDASYNQLLALRKDRPDASGGLRIDDGRVDQKFAPPSYVQLLQDNNRYHFRLAADAALTGFYVDRKQLPTKLCQPRLPEERGIFFRGDFGYVPFPMPLYNQNLRY